MIMGLICGFALNYSLGYVSVGEIIYLIYGIFLILKNGKITINKNLKNIIIWSIIFILYTSLYYFLHTDKTFLLKNIIKYADMLIITIISLEFAKADIKKFVIFFTYLLFGNSVGLYIYGNYASITEYIHYSQFLLVLFCLLLAVKSNKMITLITYILILALSIIGRSRTSLMIVFLTLIYHGYCYIKNKNISHNAKIKKVLIVSLLILCMGLGTSYISKNLSYQSQSNIERKLLLETAKQEFIDNPLIGVGPGNFNSYARYTYGIKLRSDDLATHNHFLQVLTEWGLIGFIIYMIPLIGLLIDMISSKKIIFEYRKIYIYYFVFLFFNVMSGITRFKLAIILGLLFYEKYVLRGEKCDEKCNNSIKL